MKIKVLVALLFIYLTPVLDADVRSQFDRDFSIGIIGDTQWLTYGWSGRDADDQAARFKALTQWFKEHVDSLNLIFITHVGDVVNTETQSSQWDIAVEAMTSIREAGIPWGIAPGNHDDADNYSYYNTHFGLEWWQDNEWFGGNYPEGESQNQYQVFSYGDNEFLWLHLENQVNLFPESVAWAQGIIDEHPGTRTIVTTHDYTSERGFDGDGEQLWNQLITMNDQIFMVICGHQFGVSYIQRENDAGNVVHNILVDYQNENTDLLQGATRWMEVDIENDQVFSYTINPHEEEMVTDPIRPNSFQGWVSDLAESDPDKAHHENQFTTQGLFRPALSEIVAVKKQKVNAYRPLNALGTRIYDVRGMRQPAAEKIFIKRNELPARTSYTRVFLLEFKDGGKKIRMGYHPVPLE